MTHQVVAARTPCFWVGSGEEGGIDRLLRLIGAPEATPGCVMRRSFKTTGPW